MGNRRVLSIYLGGGTPTVLDDDSLAYIIDSVGSVGDAAEVTLEANPEHVSPQRALAWKRMGVTRVSLGVQSFQDDMLRFLGRGHCGADGVKAVEILADAGFDEISVDLIYGGKYDEAADEWYEAAWEADLALVRRLPVLHASCYELTLEPHTPLHTMAKIRRVLCAEETLARMMSMAPQVLGMSRYEISNYARGGVVSAHNVSCWAGLPYLGVGVGAHSFMTDGEEISRRSNTVRTSLYMDAFSSLGAEHFDPPVEFEEHLSVQMHLAERLICAARTRFDWSPGVIAAQLGGDITPYEKGIARAVSLGLLEKNGDSYRTTVQGIALNNKLDELLFDGAPA